MTGNSLALDTNFAIAWLNGRPGLDVWLRSYGPIFLPVTVLGELHFGALNSNRQIENSAKVHNLAARTTILDVGATTARVYAELRAALKAKGRPIPGNDLWIAAACVEHAIPLATIDAHFQFIARLTTVPY